MADDLSFHEVMDDDLLNQTIGSIIDQSQQNRENILNLIRKRKQKKQACDEFSLLNECFKLWEMDDETFAQSLLQLISNGQITENSRAGKKTYSPKLDANVSNNFESISSDFVDFKKFISEKLVLMERKIELQQMEINKINTVMEMKDTIINIHKDELISSKDEINFLRGEIECKNKLIN